MKRAVAIIAVLAACGSGASQEPIADAAPVDEDAIGGCLDQANIAMGRCLLPDQSPCTSPTDDGTTYDALVGDTTQVPMVVGFQGATMFSLAIRVTGVHPGVESVPDEHPLVDVTLYNANDEQVSNYFRRLSLDPVNREPNTYEMKYVFLLVAGATQDLVGQTLTARGVVTDRDGKMACGEGSFVGAAL